MAAGKSEQFALKNKWYIIKVMGATHCGNAEGQALIKMPRRRFFVLANLIVVVVKWGYESGESGES